MAWWDGQAARPPHEEHLRASARPLRATSPYDSDRTGTWWVAPLAVLAGLGLLAGGIALVASGSGAGRIAGVALVAWGVALTSQYGVLGWYALRVPALRRRRVEAAQRGEPAPPVTDFDVQQLHVPLRGTRAPGTGAAFGLLDPGDAPTPPGVRAARLVGVVATATMWAAAVTALVVGRLS